MSRPPRIGRCGRLLALIAIAAYGSAGVFGYGLHSLWQCEHGSACCNHDAHPSHAGHEHGGEPCAEASHETAGATLAASCDDCTICSFLAQAQTSVAAALTPVGCEPLAETPPSAARLVPSLRAAAPLARGPPVA